jgi:hypothetical protein
MKFAKSFSALIGILTATGLLSPAYGQTYTANLDGPTEPSISTGTGFAQVTFDLPTHMLTVHIDFTGLTTGTTASHIHAPTTTPFSGTASVATQTPTFSGFPLGVTSGTYDNVFDMTLTSTWNSSYVTANGGTAAGAEAAFGQALADGKAYVNIHTTMFPGGEIRGFLVPEPATISLIAIGGMAFLLTKRQVRRRS